MHQSHFAYCTPVTVTCLNMAIAYNTRSNSHLRRRVSAHTVAAPYASTASSNPHLLLPCSREQRERSSGGVEQQEDSGSSDSDSDDDEDDDDDDSDSSADYEPNAANDEDGGGGGEDNREAVSHSEQDSRLAADSGAALRGARGRLKQASAQQFHPVRILQNIQQQAASLFTLPSSAVRPHTDGSSLSSSSSSSSPSSTSSLTLLTSVQSTAIPPTAAAAAFSAPPSHPSLSSSSFAEPLRLPTSTLSPFVTPAKVLHGRAGQPHLPANTPHVPLPAVFSASVDSSSASLAPTAAAATTPTSAGSKSTTRKRHRGVSDNGSASVGSTNPTTAIQHAAPSNGPSPIMAAAATATAAIPFHGLSGANTASQRSSGPIYLSAPPLTAAIAVRSARQHNRPTFCRHSCGCRQTKYSTPGLDISDDERSRLKQEERERRVDALMKKGGVSQAQAELQVGELHFLDQAAIVKQGSRKQHEENASLHHCGDDNTAGGAYSCRALLALKEKETTAQPLEPQRHRANGGTEYAPSSADSQPRSVIGNEATVELSPIQRTERKEDVLEERRDVGFIESGADMMEMESGDVQDDEKAEVTAIPQDVDHRATGALSIPSPPTSSTALTGHTPSAETEVEDVRKLWELLVVAQSRTFSAAGASVAPGDAELPLQREIAVDDSVWLPASGALCDLYSLRVPLPFGDVQAPLGPSAPPSTTAVGEVWLMSTYSTSTVSSKLPPADGTLGRSSLTHTSTLSSFIPSTPPTAGTSKSHSNAPTRRMYWNAAGFLLGVLRSGQLTCAYSTSPAELPHSQPVAGAEHDLLDLVTAPPSDSSASAPAPHADSAIRARWLRMEAGGFVQFSAAPWFGFRSYEVVGPGGVCWLCVPSIQSARAVRVVQSATLRYCALDATLTADGVQLCAEAGELFLDPVLLFLNGVDVQTVQQHSGLGQLWHRGGALLLAVVTGQQPVQLLERCHLPVHWLVAGPTACRVWTDRVVSLLSPVCGRSARLVRSILQALDNMFPEPTTSLLFQSICAELLRVVRSRFSSSSPAVHDLYQSLTTEQVLTARDELLIARLQLDRIRGMCMAGRTIGDQQQKDVRTEKAATSQFTPPS